MDKEMQEMLDRQNVLIDQIENALNLVREIEVYIVDIIFAMRAGMVLREENAALQRNGINGYIRANGAHGGHEANGAHGGNNANVGHDANEGHDANKDHEANENHEANGGHEANGA